MCDWKYCTYFSFHLNLLFASVSVSWERHGIFNYFNIGNFSQVSRLMGYKCIPSLVGWFILEINMKGVRSGRVIYIIVSLYQITSTSRYILIKQLLIILLHISLCFITSSASMYVHQNKSMSSGVYLINKRLIFLHVQLMPYSIYIRLFVYLFTSEM